MRTSRRPLALAALAVTVMVVFGALPATATTPSETFATFGSISEGSLDSTAFTVGGCGTAGLGTSDLSGTDFVPAGAATQATNSCTTDTQITVAFASALGGVDLYLVELPYGPCTDGIYTFTTDAAGPLTIGSGFSGSSVSGSSLTVPFASPNSGVIHLAGPVSYVTLSAEAGSFTATFTLGTVHVVPTTTTTMAPTTATTPGAGVADAGASAGAVVTPAFTC
jgi:hypothetical protein